MHEPVPVFKTPEGEALSMAAYEAVLKIWPVEFEEMRVETRFGATHLIASGPANGQPLILLHGQEASATMWLPNIQELSRASRVFALDTPGDIGKSRPARLPKNRADYAAWLLDVMDALHLDRVNLAGMSYGGFLALNFILAFPERVMRVALLAPGIPNFGPPTPRWAFYGMPMLMFPSHHTIKRFINGASCKGFSAGNWVHVQMMVAVPHLRDLSFPRPVFTDQELGQVRNPCLLIIGDREIMYDPAQAAARAAQLIPDLRVEIIEDAGHFVNSDQAGSVNKALMRFLNEPGVDIPES